MAAATTRTCIESGSHRVYQNEPVAIIGIGCRFPGARGPAEFWNLLENAIDAIRPIPADRFDIDSVYDRTPGTAGKISVREGGFLEKIDEFDASFFGISPREALRLDPQQRLLLEVTWEALEDGGLTTDQLDGRRTGVFIGACASDYEDIQYYLRSRAEIDFYVATGTARALMSVATTRSEWAARCRACTPQPVPRSRERPTGSRRVSCASEVAAGVMPSTW